MNIQQVLQMPLQAGKKSSLYTIAGQGVPLLIQTVENDAKQDQYEWWTQTVRVLDQSCNMQSPIKHKSKFPDSMLNQSHAGKTSVWRLKWYQGQRGQVLEGYPEKKITSEAPMTAQPAPAVPYNAPQPAQPTNPVASSIVQGMQMPSTYAYPVTPETQERMSRSVAVEAASHVLAAMIIAYGKDGGKYDWNAKYLELSDMMSMWILSGNTKADEPQAERVVCQQHGVYTDECGCFLPTGDG